MNKLKNPVVWTLLAGVAVAGVGAYQGLHLDAGSVKVPTASPTVIAARSEAPRLDAQPSLKAIDEGIANLAEYALPATVFIETGKIKSDSTSKPQDANPITREQVTGAGSGVIIRSDGYIVTNDHVVAGYDKVQVTLNDGRKYVGTVQSATESDIAVVKIDEKNLPSMPFADSNKVRPGQMAMAIGSPYTLVQSVTIGHISAQNRSNEIRDPRTMEKRVYTSLIQTDAAINRGNSGGPLINVSGEIIGLNTTIFSLTGGSNGIGFAIPSNEVRIIADQLIQGKQVRRAGIGIVPANIQEFQKKDLKTDKGAYVVEAKSNLPGGQAGIQKGDVITQVGSMIVTNQSDLRDAMLVYAPGTKVEVKFLRNGEPKSTNVTLVSVQDMRKLEPPADQDLQDSSKSKDKSDRLDDLKKLFEDQDVPGIPRDRLRDLFKDRSNGIQPQAGRKVGQAAKLGVVLSNLNADNRARYSVPADTQGALVEGVQPDSVADENGIEVGAVITQFDGKEIRSAEDLTKAMSTVKWGDTKSIAYRKFSANGQTSVSVPLSFK